MKVYLNESEILSLSEIQREVLCYALPRDIVEADIQRRIQWVVEHKYHEVFKDMKEEWEPKLKERYESLPTSDALLAQLIISQPDYKCRQQRDAEVSNG